MNTHEIIPVTPRQINGQSVQMVNARILHQFLGVEWDFSTWIKRRIKHYAFESGVDYLIISKEIVHLDSTKKWNQVGHGGDRRTLDYFLTLDMAKELAMVERTPRGRQARRYFIECENRLRQLQQGAVALRPAMPIALNHAEKQAINRQAWAEVSGQVHAVFHKRREELLQERVRKPGPIYLPYGFVPEWAK